jgi:DNA-directed RNA polymerase specialized sigma24 family protein
LFEFDGQLIQNGSTQITITRREKQQLAQVQRDIYDTHRHRTFALAFYMTGNELEAEAILTRTFVRAFDSMEEPQGRDVDAALIHELRQCFPLGEDTPLTHPQMHPPTKAVADPNFNLSGGNVRRTDMEEAVQTLPSTERFLFLLRDVEGYTPAAIAELLQMPESKVNRTLFAARLHLRQALAEAQADRRAEEAA